MRWLTEFHPTGHGWALLGATGALCAIGVGGIYLSEHELTETAAGLSAAARQLIYVVAGAVAMAATMRVSYKEIGRLTWVIYGGVVGLLVLLVVARVLARWSIQLPLIPPSRDTFRWIQLPGFQVQPSEFAKPAVVVALAWYLRFRRNYRSLPGLAGPFVLTVAPMLLILLEPDLGTAVLLMPVLLLMLLLAGAKVRHLAAVVAACCLAGPLMFHFAMRDYQKMRVLGPLMQSESVRAFVLDHPGGLAAMGIDQNLVRRWKVDKGEQLAQSKIAIGSGGLAGRWSDDHVRYLELPDRHNDFIFAVVANRWGLLGGAVVLLCFAVIALVGLDIAAETPDPFARLLAVGLTAVLCVQCLINVGMAVGLTPVTGMTLPFVSYGGSSMVASFLMVGLLINVARRRPVLLSRKPFEYDRDTNGL